MQDVNLTTSHVQKGACGGINKHLQDISNKLNNKNNGIYKRALTILLGTLILIFIPTVIVCAKLFLNFGIVCPFYEIFGLSCPGCGGTRMVISILHLDFYQAFRYNPFIFCTSPLLAVIYVWQSYEYIVKNRISVWLDKALIIYAILLIIFGVIRNIGIFNILAPTVV